MQTANDVTIAALRYVHAHVERGMSAADIGTIMDAATIGAGRIAGILARAAERSLGLSARLPQPQTVRDGSVILMDCGCTVQGYQSDISRTWVFGRANARQRKVWDTVKRGQEIALQTAKLGSRSRRAIDDAVRDYYESEGWGPGYRLPGLSHRTGHGIGLDGHEPAYLVHGDSTPARIRHVFLRRAGHLYPRRVRHTPGGLLAHECIGARAIHPPGQNARRSRLRLADMHRAGAGRRFRRVPSAILKKMCRFGPRAL